MVQVAEAGLSPPTRGSPKQGKDRADEDGSIPAHAGEPSVCGLRAPVHGVYPRPRGGAFAFSARPRWCRGLSPPTRGSRVTSIVPPLGQRSIPAHAGEPATLNGAGQPTQVYPRPRGGAVDEGVKIAIVIGLSPPTRGSRRRLALRLWGSRSIPAHAGEPSKGLAIVIGLSPPTRGSLLPRHANMTYLLRFGPDYIKICQKTQVSASGGARRTRRTPSASQISFGGSPKWRRASLPDSATSRWIITTPPFPSVSNHRDTTAQMRSRTPLDISGATYTPGATSSIAEARNPR